MFTYDQEKAWKTDRAYQSPDITRQRMRVIEALQPRQGEALLDIGCGSGLLAGDIAPLLGVQGRLLGIDNSPDMLDLARQRCADLAQVRFEEGDAARLPTADGGFDGATCTQVLLYVADVEAAIAEMHRVVKPGGRVVIVETDWRGTVLNSADEAMTRKMLTAWDATVASPNLPSKLVPMLEAGGFKVARIEAFPIINTSLNPANFSATILEQFADIAPARGEVTESETRAWLEDLHARDAEGAFFFCVNRFIFTAISA